MGGFSKEYRDELMDFAIGPLNEMIDRNLVGNLRKTLFIMSYIDHKRTLRHADYLIGYFEELEHNIGIHKPIPPLTKEAFLKTITSIHIASIRNREEYRPFSDLMIPPRGISPPESLSDAVMQLKTLVGSPQILGDMPLSV